MSDFEDKVLKALTRLDEGQKQLQSDVVGLQEGQKQLQSDVVGLQEGQKQLQGDVSRLEVLHEETSEKIDQILEGFSPTIESTNTHSTQIQDHENRISFLENTTNAT